MEGTFTMSIKELERVKVLAQVIDKKISQTTAAKKIKVSDRQFRRILKEYKINGEKSVISKKRGNASNRCVNKSLKNKILKVVSDYYPDYGPSLANEYLKENHNIHISTETLRIWMTERHLWIPRNSINKKNHPLRNRRPCFGELIQIDGSHHFWFEDRADSCVLMVFIDDATSTITSLYFPKTESLNSYYEALKIHLKKYGIPLAVYGDRCSVLTPRNPVEKNSTQFKKALKDLQCELILAYSPQAKGRVERANRTLQDRLVKYLRLKGISSIEEGNKILEEYRKMHNQHFSKKPSEQSDVHRSLDGISVDQVLCTRETRTLSKDNVLQHKNTFYQISSQHKNIHLFKGAKIEIRETLDGKLVALFKSHLVEIKPLMELETVTLDEKEIKEWKSKRRYIPQKTHPFKHKYFNEKIKEDIMEYVI